VVLWDGWSMWGMRYQYHIVKIYGINKDIDIYL